MRPTNPELVAHLLREVLEGAMAPNLAGAVFFEALAEEPGHELPAEATALDAFLRDRLGPTLVRHVGARHAEPVLEQLRERVRAVLGRPQPVRPSQLPTANVGAERGPVRVIVIGARARLASGLRAALGRELVAPYFAPDAEIAQRMIDSLRPSILLVDGDDERIDPSLLDVVSRAREPLVLVWAADRPAGCTALERLRQGAQRVVALPGVGGAELLMDYVRARRAQS